jgi:hypothetical protein
LQAVYPRSFSSQNIQRALLATFPDMGLPHIRVDLAYLVDKGYVNEADPGFGKDIRTCDWQDRRWILTARGTEVAQKITEDPALDI